MAPISSHLSINPSNPILLSFSPLTYDRSIVAAKQGPTTTKQQQPAGDMDPRFDWIDNAASYVLRLHLQGFKKDDFRVQVDGAGRLTVRGHHAAAHSRSFHKVFQLPSAANLDEISGRFEAGVLTLTVPKRATSTAAPPTTIEDLIMKPFKEAAAAAAAKDQVHGTAAKLQPKDGGGAEKKEAKPKEEISKVDAVPEKTKESKLKEEISKVGADVKKKAMDVAAAAAGKVPLPPLQHTQEAKKPEQKQTPAPMPPVKDAKTPESATEKHHKPEAAGEKGKAIEQGKNMAEERVKAAVDESEPEKKASWCGGWKELVPEDLVDMKWADGLVETARNNKELIAATIAAFSLGFLLSHKLFSRN